MDELRSNGIGGVNPFASSGADGLLRATNSGSSSGSSFANEMGSALNNLSGLDNSDKLRDDAIQNAKAIIKNWTPPTESQIATIFQKMRNELLA